MPVTDGTYQWGVINDFSPGIFSQTRGAMTDFYTPLRAPRGACNYEGTYNCIVMPNGGLGATPQLLGTYDLPSPDTGADSPGYVITGIQAYGPIVPGGFATVGTGTGLSGTDIMDCLYVSVEWIRSGVRKKVIYRLNTQKSAYTVDTVSPIFSSTDNYRPPLYWGTSWAIQRVFNTAGTSLMVTLATDWTSKWINGLSGATSESRVHLLPSPDVAAEVMDFTGATAGPLLAHQNRIVQMTMPSADVTQAAFGPGNYTYSNDLISFTNPSSWTATTFFALNNQQLATEYPHGYGSWGSISSGELWLAKRNGGAIVIAGDVSNPIITRLPGVQSTGVRTGRSIHTTQGLVYLVERDGVWIWAGGNTSEKISQNVDDSHFNDARGYIVPFSTDYHLTAWGDWVLFPQNLLYDMRTKSWWRLTSTGNFNAQMWSGSLARTGRYVFGAKAAYTQSGTAQIALWDRTRWASDWTWFSQPLEESVGRRIDIRKVELDFTFSYNPGSTCNVTVSLLDRKGDAVDETKTITIPTNRKSLKLDFDVAVQATTECQIRVQVLTSPITVPAPILNYIAYAWKEATSVGRSAP